jgi:hypothetical protein
MAVEARYGILECNDTVNNLPNGPFAMFGRMQLKATDVALEGLDLFSARVVAFNLCVESSMEHYK